MSDQESEEYYPRLSLTLSPPGQGWGGGEVQSQRGTASSASGRAGGQIRGGSQKEERIEPPYPWSTDRRAVVRPLEWLLGNGLTHIYGEASCKKCRRSHTASVEVEPTFHRIRTYFLENRHAMHDRAPAHWSAPGLLDCPLCAQPDCLRPHLGTKKRAINWLFLLLTQRLGLCTLDQLKYFCKHTRRHRTGAKDRVLYLTYAGLLKQLDPSTPYDD